VTNYHAVSKAGFLSFVDRTSYLIIRFCEMRDEYLRTEAPGLGEETVHGDLPSSGPLLAQHVLDKLAKVAHFTHTLESPWQHD